MWTITSTKSLQCFLCVLLSFSIARFPGQRTGGYGLRGNITSSRASCSGNAKNLTFYIKCNANLKSYRIHINMHVCMYFVKLYFTIILRHIIQNYL